MTIMKRLRSLDINKLHKLRCYAPIRKALSDTDMELLTQQANGKTIVSLAHKYNRSESSIYRLYHRAEKILYDTECSYIVRMRYLALLRSTIYIPRELETLQVFGTHKLITTKIYVLTLGIYRSGLESIVPRWLLVKIAGGLSNKQRCETVINEMRHMLFMRHNYTFNIYESVYYENGIRFEFSPTSEALLNAVPKPKYSKDIDSI